MARAGKAEPQATDAPRDRSRSPTEAASTGPATGTGRRDRRRKLRLIGYPLLVVIGFIMLQSCATLDRLFFYGGPDPGPPPAGVEQVRFVSEDGLLLHGWWTPAACPPAQAKGTVVHAHGNAMSVDNHYEISAFLAEYGFNVLIFDYRGYGRSEGKIRRREQALADVRAALRYARTRPDVDARRLALLGQSIGGALALMAGPDEPKLGAIVAITPFATWRRVAANVVAGCDPPNRLGRSVAWLCVRQGCEPLECLAEIHCPILLLHGTRDEIVPFGHSEALYAAGREEGLAVTLRRIEGGDHNNLPINEPPLAEEIAGWLERALRGDEFSDASASADAHDSAASGSAATDPQGPTSPYAPEGRQTGQPLGVPADDGR